MADGIKDFLVALVKPFKAMKQQAKDANDFIKDMHVSHGDLRKSFQEYFNSSRGLLNQSTVEYLLKKWEGTKGYREKLRENLKKANTVESINMELEKINTWSWLESKDDNLMRQFGFDSNDSFKKNLSDSFQKYETFANHAKELKNNFLHGNYGKYAEANANDIEFIRQRILKKTFSDVEIINSAINVCLPGGEAHKGGQSDDDLRKQGLIQFLNDPSVDANLSKDDLVLKKQLKEELDLREKIKKADELESEIEVIKILKNKLSLEQIGRLKDEKLKIKLLSSLEVVTKKTILDKKLKSLENQLKNLNINLKEAKNLLAGLEKKIQFIPDFFRLNQQIYELKKEIQDKKPMLEAFAEVKNISLTAESLSLEKLEVNIEAQVQAMDFNSQMDFFFKYPVIYASDFYPKVLRYRDSLNNKVHLYNEILDEDKKLTENYEYQLKENIGEDAKREITRKYNDKKLAEEYKTQLNENIAKAEVELKIILKYEIIYKSFGSLVSNKHKAELLNWIKEKFRKLEKAQNSGNDGNEIIILIRSVSECLINKGIISDQEKLSIEKELQKISGQEIPKKDVELKSENLIDIKKILQKLSQIIVPLWTQISRGFSYIRAKLKKYEPIPENPPEPSKEIREEKAVPEEPIIAVAEMPGKEKIMPVAEPLAVAEIPKAELMESPPKKEFSDEEKMKVKKNVFAKSCTEFKTTEETFYTAIKELINYDFLNVEIHGAELVEKLKNDKRLREYLVSFNDLASDASKMLPGLFDKLDEEKVEKDPGGAVNIICEDLEKVFANEEKYFTARDQDVVFACKAMEDYCAKTYPDDSYPGVHDMRDEINKRAKLVIQRYKNYEHLLETLLEKSDNTEVLNDVKQIFEINQERNDEDLIKAIEPIKGNFNNSILKEEMVRKLAIELFHAKKRADDISQKYKFISSCYEVEDTEVTLRNKLSQGLIENDKFIKGNELLLGRYLVPLRTLIRLDLPKAFSEVKNKNNFDEVVGTICQGFEKIFETERTYSVFRDSSIVMSDISKDFHEVESLASQPMQRSMRYDLLLKTILENSGNKQIFVTVEKMLADKSDITDENLIAEINAGILIKRIPISEAIISKDRILNLAKTLLHTKQMINKVNKCIAVSDVFGLNIAKIFFNIDINSLPLTIIQGSLKLRLDAIKYLVPEYQQKTQEYLDKINQKYLDEMNKVSPGEIKKHLDEIEKYLSDRLSELSRDAQDKINNKDKSYFKGIRDEMISAISGITASSADIVRVLIKYGFSKDEKEAKKIAQKIKNEYYLSLLNDPGLREIIRDSLKEKVSAKEKAPLGKRIWAKIVGFLLFRPTTFTDHVMRNINKSVGKNYQEFRKNLKLLGIDNVQTLYSKLEEQKVDSKILDWISSNDPSINIPKDANVVAGHEPVLGQQPIPAEIKPSEPARKAEIATVSIKKPVSTEVPLLALPEDVREEVNKIAERSMGLFSDSSFLNQEFPYLERELDKSTVYKESIDTSCVFIAKVRKDILSNPDKQMERIGHWVKVMIKSREVGNYSALVEIYLALNRPPSVAKLFANFKLSLRNSTEPTKWNYLNYLNYFDKLFSEWSDKAPRYSKLREEMDRKLKSGENIIPWVGAYRAELLRLQLPQNKLSDDEKKKSQRKECISSIEQFVAKQIKISKTAEIEQQPLPVEPSNSKTSEKISLKGLFGAVSFSVIAAAGIILVLTGTIMIPALLAGIAAAAAVVAVVAKSHATEKELEAKPIVQQAPIKGVSTETIKADLLKVKPEKEREKQPNEVASNKVSFEESPSEEKPKPGEEKYHNEEGEEEKETEKEATEKTALLKNANGPNPSVS
jgi:hypothetical protein